ncbi:MAG: NADH-quinone oxidoreductase subunit C [Deltaproteobacteria bacterium]|jgi:NADH-quinone oxidoreductase subunit C|nr:NADH-quinone oxidoreductase subunit C [Deltaproteobacteria bacterium]
MTSIDHLEQIFRQVGARLVSKPDFKTRGICCSGLVPAKAIVDLAKLLAAEDHTLLDVSVLEAKEGFLITYHFDSFSEPGRLAARVLAPRENPVVPSLHSVFQGAEWHERESHDFYGVRFDGNPNLVPLLLPEDFSGPPPLRKAPGDLAGLADLGVFDGSEILDPSCASLVPARPAPPAAVSEARDA